ncbi:MAG TPA: DMT family transporter [Planctomycetota bacterium]|nr:DMT family transporter [Planctomycetota bacterium]
MSVSRHGALVALIAGACIIGLAPIFMRLSPIGPAATTFWRMLLAIPALWAWRAWSARGHETRVDDGRAGTWIIVAGLLLGLDLVIWHASIHLTSVANATVMANLSPVFVVLFAAVLFRTRPRGVFLIGMTAAIGGAVTMALASARGDGAGHVRGDCLALCSAASYAGYLMVVERLRHVRTTSVIMCGAAIASAAALAPVALVLEPDAFMPADAVGWLPLIGLALIVHVIGQGLITYAFAQLPASFGAIALLIQPVVAAALAWIWFGEAVGLQQCAGAVAILAGIVIAKRAG